MDADRHRERTKLLPLNLHSQPHFQSPSKDQRQSNAAIPRVLKRDSVDREFDSILKRAHYPYLSKVSLGRKRFTSNKRPQRNDRIYGSEEINLKTQPKKGSMSESKAKSRYYTKPIEQELQGNTKRFFYQQPNDSKEKTSSVSTKNGSLGSRSYFLKKLKERYGNKHIRQATDKPELQISSEKVTLIHHSNHMAQQEVYEDEHGVQTMILAETSKFQTPDEVVVKFGDRMRTFEREVQINQYPEIWYFTEDCLPEKQPQLDNETVEEDQLVYDDKDGGYLWREKSHIAYRYEITGMLGQGSFGQVFKCIDHREEEEVAVKMVRNRQKYTKQAQIEIDILNYVKSSDPHATKNLVLAKESFRWREHTCIVFELLSMNLYELIKLNDYYGLPLDLIRRFSLQLLNGMHLLHKHEIIHADLKPENVLLKQVLLVLRQPNKSGLKIIDFGSSCFIRNRIYTYIQSRYYRAPEVILGVPYDYKIDVWSFACIIAELYIGYPIFPGENEKEQMWLIMETIGVPPTRLLEDSTRRHHYFDQMLRPLPFSNSKGKEYVAMSNPLSQIIDSKDKSFCKFLESCFVWEADKRPTALQCLRHQWIMEGLPQDIRRQHLRFIDQEESLLRMQRKRSPAAREMKMNESPPARARPAYFDRSRQRQRLRVEGASKPPQTKAFLNLEGLRCRERDR